MDGIYTGYFTGEAGNGLAMFTLIEGRIVGADAAGVLFDGTYEPASEGFRLVVRVIAPAGGVMIQGVSTGNSAVEYQVDTVVSQKIDALPFITFSTPYGLVNVKFRKLRDV